MASRETIVARIYFFIVFLHLRACLDSNKSLEKSLAELLYNERMKNIISCFAFALILAPSVLAATPNSSPKLLLELNVNAFTSPKKAAFISRPVGDDLIKVAVQIGSDSSLWTEFRQEGVTRIYSREELAKGATAVFPSHRYFISLKNDAVWVKDLDDPQGVQAKIVADDLLRPLYDSVDKITIDSLVFAPVYQPGPQPEASVCLLQFEEGNFYVMHEKVSALRKSIQWFLGVDQTMYGAKLNGGVLQFYGKRGPWNSAPKFLKTRESLEPLLN